VRDVNSNQQHHQIPLKGGWETGLSFFLKIDVDRLISLGLMSAYVRNNRENDASWNVTTEISGTRGYGVPHQAKAVRRLVCGSAYGAFRSSVQTLLRHRVAPKAFGSVYYDNRGQEEEI